MTPQYPASFDFFVPLVDGVDYPMAEYLNDLHRLILDLQIVLGISPQLPSQNVSARLDTLTPPI